jgi:hypothetical protein
VHRVLAFCLATAALQAGPLAVVQVVREGLPPYEDSNRVYRLEGDGCDQLRPGRVILLVRAGERRPLGQLEVVSTGSGFAMARIRRAGATYPLKGDLAVPREPIRTPPALPRPGQALPAAEGVARRPAAPALPVPPAGAAHREPIFFLGSEATLTPGAKAKLKAWVAAWGRAGRWVLAQPPDQPPALAEARAAALRDELSLLGVAQVELGPAEQEPPGKYPAVFVVHNPC